MPQSPSMPAQPSPSRAPAASATSASSSVVPVSPSQAAVSASRSGVPASPSRAASAAVSASTSRAPASASRSPAPPYLPAGLQCEWVIDVGSGQGVELTWEWAQVGGTAEEPACREDGPSGDNVLAAYSGAYLLDAPCYVASPSVLAAPDASTITVALTLGDAVPARGFAASFVVWERSSPSPAPARNCTLGPWSAWGACSATCGGGTRTRTREVATPASNGGSCPFPLEESAPCATASCAPVVPDVPCNVSDWGAWSDCAVPAPGCGEGTRSRSRAILQPASGRGTPCPPASALEEVAPCAVPCLQPACDPSSRPLLSHSLSGGIGIGRHRGAAAGGPRYPGNTNCSWVLDPVAAGWPASGAPPVVNLTLQWLDVPSSAACAQQHLVVASLSTGQPLAPPMCGSAFPADLRIAGGSIVAAPGDGLRVTLVTRDGGGVGLGTGFGAAFSISAAGVGPAPLPAPSAAQSTALVALAAARAGAWSTWPLLSDLAAAAAAELSAATGASPYRFTGFQLVPPASGSGVAPSLQLQVVPPLAAGGRPARALAPSRSPAPRASASPSPAAVPAEPSVLDVLQAVYAQLATPSSPLRQGAWGGGLDPLVFDTAWATPATAVLQPAALSVTLRASSWPPAAVELSLALSNQGGAPLVLAAIGFTYAPAADGGSAPLGDSFLSVRTSGSFPIVLPASPVPPFASLPMTVRVNPAAMPSPAALPALAAGVPVTAFAVLTLDVSDLQGQRTVPLTVVLQPAASASPAPSPAASATPTPSAAPAAGSLLGPEFVKGAGVGAGALAAALVLLFCSWCCCCRRNAKGKTLCRRCLGLCKRGRGPTPAAGAGRKAGDGKGDGKEAEAGADKEKGKRKGRGADEESRGALDGSCSDSEGEGAGGRAGKKGRGRRASGEAESSGLVGGLGQRSIELAPIRLPKPAALEAVAVAPGAPAPPAAGSSGEGLSAPSSLFGGLSLAPSGGGGGIAFAPAPAPPSGSFVATSGLAPPTGGGGGQWRTGAAGGGPSAAPGSAGGAAGSGAPLPGGSLPKLRPKPVLRAAEFEAKWAQLDTVELWGTGLARLPGPGELEAALAPHHLSCMASGVLNGVHKLFFFCSPEGEQGLAIGEISVATSSQRLSALIKASSPALGHAFLAALKGGIAPFA